MGSKDSPIYPAAVKHGFAVMKLIKTATGLDHPTEAAHEYAEAYCELLDAQQEYLLRIMPRELKEAREVSPDVWRGESYG